jgi:hypothetical protein
MRSSDTIFLPQPQLIPPSSATHKPSQLRSRRRANPSRLLWWWAQPEQSHDGGSDVAGRAYATLAGLKTWRRKVRYPLASVAAGPSEWNITDES